MALLRVHPSARLLGPRKPADAQPDLEGIDAGIGRREACVGNVHVARFNAPIVFSAQEVHAERSAARKINLRRPCGHFVIREQCSPA
jgi:hypothetical protein